MTLDLLCRVLEPSGIVGSNTLGALCEREALHWLRREEVTVSGFYKYPLV
jgi:hypothetical protein